MANPMVLGTGGSPQSIYADSATQHHQVGTRGQFDDGRVFYYAKNVSTALDVGKLMAGPATTANHVAQNNNTLVAGEKTVLWTAGATAVVENDYEEGFLSVDDATGEGYSYKIKSNSAALSAGVTTIELYDEIALASAAATTSTLTRNQYRGIRVNPTTAAGAHQVGVTTCPVALGTEAAPRYAWVQTYGEKNVWIDGTPAIGSQLIGSTTSAGDVTIRVAAGLDVGMIGYILQTGLDTEYIMAFLTIRA